jgi:hypothetical protein
MKLGGSLGNAPQKLKKKKTVKKTDNWIGLDVNQT